MENIRAAPVKIAWHSGLPIYASPDFLKASGDEYGWIGGVNETGGLCCILPYVVIRKAGLQMVRFRTATIFLQEEFSIREERVFLSSAVEYFRAQGTDLIIPSGNSAIFRTYPDGAFAAPYATVIKELSKPELSLWNEIRKTYRQNIHKAQAAEVKVSSGLHYFDASYQLIADTMRRSGASFMTYKELERKLAGLGENLQIFVAEHRGVLQGCMVSPFSLHAAYNCYAGSRPEPTLGAMHLLHWEAIRHFRAMGVKRFDFQGLRVNPARGSKQDGIACYKRGFGGNFVQGYLWKYGLRPVKFAVYTLAVRLLMGGDTVDQEGPKPVST